jgi:hypothetical protein
MRNNTNDAKGKGYPLKITAVEVKVIDNPDAGATDRDIEFVKRILPTIEWTALVQVKSERNLVFLSLLSMSILFGFLPS